MTTQTAAKTEAKAAAQFGEIQDESQSLPPMLALEAGDIVKGILKAVAIVADEDREGKFRFFYRMELLENAEGVNTDKERTEYEAGAIVSVPGSGGLDYQMSVLARKVAGQDDESAKPKWSALYGHLIVLERKADEKMTKGKYKGKPVKCFSVGHAAPVKA